MAPVMRLLVLLLLWAGSVSAAVHNVSTAGQLTTAMAAAVAGDEIILANGTYTGAWNTGNAGSSGSKITLRAANKHLAILAGTQECDDNANGLVVDQPWWIIKDLRWQQHGTAIRITTTNTEIAHNIIEEYYKLGIFVASGDSNILHHNVVAHSFQSCGDNYGIMIQQDADANTIQDNIIVGTGTNIHTTAGSQQGYGLQINNNSDDTLVQGNLFLANLGKGILRILSGEDTSPLGTLRSKVYDNLLFFGEGELSSGDCTDDSTEWINNIHYGNYFWNWQTKGNFDGTKGNHTLSHNLFYATTQTRANVGFTTGGAPFCTNEGPKVNNTMKDNIFYANHAQETGGSVAHQLLWVDGQFDTPPAFVAGGNADNLFWAPGSEAGWTPNYTYAASDIHAAASEPLFTNAAAGNFTLQSGSPGKGAGTGGSDIGIAYNSFLKLAWAQQVMALASAETTGLGSSTSTSFSVDVNRFYQLWFYLPNSPCGDSDQVFTVEGSSAELSRNIPVLNDPTWTQVGGPARYISLGRHRSTDGTLNVSWENTTCVERVMIRALPSATEAYGWISALDPVAPTTSPVAPAFSGHWVR